MSEPGLRRLGPTSPSTYGIDGRTIACELRTEPSPQGFSETIHPLIRSSYRRDGARGREEGGDRADWGIIGLHPSYDGISDIKTRVRREDKPPEA